MKRVLDADTELHPFLLLGFLMEGSGNFIPSGVVYDMMKEKFSFLTCVLEVTVTSVKQTL